MLDGPKQACYDRRTYRMFEDVWIIRVLLAAFRRAVAIRRPAAFRG